MCHVVNHIGFFLIALLWQFVFRKLMAYFVTIDAFSLNFFLEMTLFGPSLVHLLLNGLVIFIGLRTLTMFHNIGISSYTKIESLPFWTLVVFLNLKSNYQFFNVHFISLVLKVISFKAGVGFQWLQPLRKFYLNSSSLHEFHVKSLAVLALNWFPFWSLPS